MKTEYCKRLGIGEQCGVGIDTARPAIGIQIPQARGAFRRDGLAQRFMQAAEHDVGQHLAGYVADGDRCRMLGIEDRALRCGNADGCQRARVIRHVRGDDAFDAERGIGLGVAKRHVDAV